MGKTRNNTKKFKLLELINNEPFNKRTEVRNEVKVILDVSESTFQRILYANIESKQEISATKLMNLASYFGVSAEELLNYDTVNN